MTTPTLVKRPPNLLGAVAAFLRIDFIDEISYPASLLMRELGVMVPVFVTFFVSQLVEGSENAAAAVGGDYFTFAVVGMAITIVLQAALSGFGRAMQRTQDRGLFETLLVEPVPWTFLPVAMNLWRVVMGGVNASVVLLIGGLLGANYRIAGIPGFVAILFLGIWASISIGIAAASFMVLSKRSQPIIQLYGLAASLLAGAVFSVDQLPAWLKPLSWLIPHTYAINAAREQLIASPGSFSISFGTAAVALGLFSVVFMALGAWLFNQSLQYARKMGMLSGY